MRIRVSYPFIALTVAIAFFAAASPRPADAAIRASGIAAALVAGAAIVCGRRAAFIAVLLAALGAIVCGSLLLARPSGVNVRPEPRFEMPRPPRPAASRGAGAFPSYI